MAPRYLHVANGSSVTTTLAAAGVPGTLSIWADPLHDGPVPGGLDDDALMEVRRQHHAPSTAAADPENDMRHWREAIANHHAYDELVLWFEHDLFDQLNLIQLLPFIRAHVPASKTVSLICVGAFQGYPHFHGLGELQAPDLASLFPTRQPVTAAQYNLADEAWRAFREPTPEALDALVGAPEAARHDSALPFLARALRRFLEDYPWTRDGLSRTERRLMTLASERRADWPAVFPRMIEGEDAYYVTDTELIALTESLAGGSTPLLAETNGSLSITPAGRDVLDGRADRVALCGIDRWFGGVHLEGRAVPWRWDAGRDRIVPGQF